MNAWNKTGEHYPIEKVLEHSVYMFNMAEWELYHLYFCLFFFNAVMILKNITYQQPLVSKKTSSLSPRLLEMLNPNTFTQRHIYQQNKTLIKYLEVQNPHCKNKKKTKKQKKNPHSIHFLNTYYVLGTVLENKEKNKIHSQFSRVVYCTHLYAL